MRENGPRETIVLVRILVAAAGWMTSACALGLPVTGLVWAAAGSALAQKALAQNAQAQKQGGTFRVYNSSNPPSASIYEEATVAAVMPFAAIFSNLVQYDPAKPRNGFDTIIPELAESWVQSPDGTQWTFKLRQGVTWHDGKPFTAKDVQCTWHRLNGKEPDHFRRNPRKVWWENIKEVTTDGDNSATFHLMRPQPSLIAMLASGFSPVYPCHVQAKDMRVAPVGTGPFKFVEFKSNDSIKLVRNSNYWRQGLPRLDGIEWRIVASRSTRVPGLCRR